MRSRLCRPPLTIFAPNRRTELDPDLLSAHGALLLLAAVMAAGRRDATIMSARRQSLRRNSGQTATVSGPGSGRRMSPFTPSRLRSAQNCRSGLWKSEPDWRPLAFLWCWSAGRPRCMSTLLPLPRWARQTGRPRTPPPRSRTGRPRDRSHQHPGTHAVGRPAVEGAESCDTRASTAGGTGGSAGVSDKPVLALIVAAAPPALRIAELIDLLISGGWTVCVTATPTAATSIDREALARQTGYPVRVEWRQPGDPEPHPAADVVVVAPATFNLMNKWALGINDNVALGILNQALGAGLPILSMPFRMSNPNLPLIRPTLRASNNSRMLARTSRLSLKKQPGRPLSPTSRTQATPLSPRARYLPPGGGRVSREHCMTISSEPGPGRESPALAFFPPARPWLITGCPIVSYPMVSVRRDRRCSVGDDSRPPGRREPIRRRDAHRLRRLPGPGRGCAGCLVTALLDTDSPAAGWVPPSTGRSRCSPAPASRWRCWPTTRRARSTRRRSPDPPPRRSRPAGPAMSVADGCSTRAGWGRGTHRAGAASVGHRMGGHGGRSGA